MNWTCLLDLHEDEMGKELSKNAADAAMCWRHFSWVLLNSKEPGRLKNE